MVNLRGLLDENSIVMSSKRKRGGLSDASLEYVKTVNDILKELKEHWPLTLRQVYYQLVARGFVQNNLRAYQKLSRILTKARLLKLVSWDTIEDRSRQTLYSAGWDDATDFVEDEVKDFLKGYRRSLLQSQSYALELWIEKDALSRVCHRIAFDYCVPVIVAKGFSSVTYVHEGRKRIEQNYMQGKLTRILYLGDFDPSGWSMLPAILDTLQNEMKLGDQVQGIRVALTKGQVAQFRLPTSPDAIKKRDTRAKKFVQEFGDVAVELDALPPLTLEQLIREAIENNLDMSKFEAESVREEEERNRLETLRRRVKKLLDKELKKDSSKDAGNDRNH